MKENLYKYCICFCLLFAPFIGLKAQNARFDRITIENGLSQSSIQCLLQDKNGLVWLGTEDGLNCYNGYQSKVYYHDAMNENSLSHNIINNIFEEDNGVFWVGALQGINKLNTKLGTVERFYNSGDVSSDKNYFTTIKQDAEKPSQIWVGTHEGVWAFDKKKETFTAFQPELFAHLRVLTIQETSGDLLWVGSRRQGVRVWNRATAQLAHSLEPADFGHSEIGVLMVYGFDDGRVWIGTTQGLYEMSQEGTLRLLDEFGRNPVSVLHERNDGIWLGTHQGLCHIREGKKTWYYHNMNDAHSLSNDRIASIITDNAGVLWVGTYFGGVSKYNAYAHQIAYYTDDKDADFYLESKVIRAITKDEPNDRVWVGTNKGLSCFDRKENKTYHYGLEAGLKDLIIRALHIDASGRLWVGTGGNNGYLHYWDEKNKRFFKVDASLGYENAPPRNAIYAINSSRDGTLWVGMQGAGLYRLPADSKTFLSYKNEEGKTPSLCNDFVNAILEDRNHDMWFATRGGLAYMATSKGANGFRNYLKEGNSQNSLPHGYVKSLYEDPEGKLWLGMAGTGLVKMEDTTGVFKQFTQANGLPNNMVYSVLPDGNGKLWISTNRGIAQFDGKREGIVRILDVSDGLQGHEYNTGAYHRASDGELFFGGVNGLNSFYPSKLELNHTNAKPWIASLQIFNKPVEIDSSNAGLLSKSIAFTDTLNLDYTHQVFTLEAIAIHHASPKDNHISYRMVGLDDEWHTMNASRRFITYTTLPPDTYVFELKAGNSDGVWGEKTRILLINIAPPIWQTWWFKSLIAIIIVASILLIYRWRVADLTQQRKILEQQVRERTAILEEQKQEIHVKKEEILVQNEELRQQQDEILAQRDFIEEKNRLLVIANDDLEYANQQMLLQKDMIEASLRNLEHLSKIGKEITSLLNITEITRTVYEHVNMLMDASGFGVGLYSEHSEQIEFHGFIEHGEELPPFTNPLKPEKYLSAHCFAFRKEIIIQQKVAKNAMKYIKEPLEVNNVGQMPNSIIYLPLMSEGRVIGVITVQSLFEKAYAEYEINMLRNIAIYVAIALDNARAYDIIRQNNKNIKDSIEYASNIQQAVLPDDSSIKAVLDEYFIIYEPKDIVSGDLYWFSKPEKKGQEYAVVLMDCTGHGVPGAFMSLIGNTLLNEIVSEVGTNSPLKILRLLEQSIRTALRQDVSNNNDGMDISICFIKQLPDDKVLLRFAGAKQSCYYVENGEMMLLKGTRRSLGGKNYTNSPVSFDEHEVIIPKGTNVYMFTDGFIDQNGKSSQRRFGSKRLLNLLKENAHLPMYRQHEEVFNAYNTYRGNAEQRDDITLMGLRV